MRALALFPGLLAASALAWPGQAYAQLPFDGCVGRDDRPVRGIVKNDVGWAGVATIQNGEPVIYWNADANEHTSRPTQIFIYLHECAHHTLGHLWKPNALKWEIEADCWAAQLMLESGMIRGSHIPVLERELRTTRGDATHLGGEALMRSLRRCLDAKTDPAAWATALEALTAASRDSFTSIEGQAVPAPHRPSGRFETEVDLPGTYDCEITRTRQVRCVVFAARDAGRTRDRYRKLVKVLRRWLPAGWTADEPAKLPEGVAHSFVAEDGERGTRIALVATDQHRIVFAMFPARIPDMPLATPTVVARTDAPSIVANAESPPVVATADDPPVIASAEGVKQSGGIAPAHLPDTLALGTAVRIRVPQLGQDWITARVTRTTGAAPCLAFELDRTDAGGRTQYAFLRAVAAIEVRVADWVAFSLERAKRQDAECRR